MKANKRGFTLIELMIALVIAGILAAVAVPSYMSSLKKGRRADAYGGILKVQQAQEKFRANCPNYALTLSASTPNCATQELGLGTATTTDGYYTLSISAPTAAGHTIATGYRITATATGSQTSDTGCTSITYELAGTTESKSPDTCWSK